MIEIIQEENKLIFQYATERESAQFIDKALKVYGERKFDNTFWFTQEHYIGSQTNT